MIPTKIMVKGNYQASSPPPPPVPQLLEIVRPCAIIGNSWRTLAKVRPCAIIVQLLCNCAIIMQRSDLVQLLGILGVPMQRCVFCLNPRVAKIRLFEEAGHTDPF